MKRLSDLLLYQFARLGRAGALGVLLLAGALVFDLVQLRPLETERDELLEQNRLAAMQPAAAKAGSAEARVASAAALPVATAAEEGLRQLFDAAAKNGLTLDQGDYSMSSEKSGEIHRYQINLPVQGSYPDLRAFIAQSLNENPALALAHVELMREVIEDTDLQATLRFTLFLKEVK
jgi:Tfp pilus assembly protein PilO